MANATLTGDFFFSPATLAFPFPAKKVPLTLVNSSGSEACDVVFLEEVNKQPKKRIVGASLLCAYREALAGTSPLARRD